MQPDLLGDSEFVAQYGAREADPPFRCCPRFPWEQDISLLRGQPSVREACRLVRRRDVADTEDGVRYAIVGTLRAAGFTVTHTPSAAIPGHVSVTWVDSWTAEQDTDFDACFGKPQWRERGDV
jgi:hypothetical protein